MKRFVAKAALIAACVTAVAAFAVPAMASAAPKWGPGGTTTSLNSSNTTLEIPALNYAWSCSSQALGVRAVLSPALEVKSAKWSGCIGFKSAAGCNATLTASKLPWTITAVAENLAYLNVGNIRAVLGCNGEEFNFFGTVMAGVWNPSAHSLTFTNATGLTAEPVTSPGAKLSMLVNGSSTDPSQVLTLK